MDCETARARVIDALADSIDDRTRIALESHLADCTACAAEADRLRALWAELGELEVPRPAPASSDRLRATLLAAAAGSADSALQSGAAALPASGRGPGRSTIALLAASIALVIGAGAGWFARGAFGPAVDASTETVVSAPAGGRGQFLLLLHGPPSPPPGSPAASDSAVAAIVARYAAWADTLQMRDQLVLAEKLEDGTGRWLGPAPAGSAPASDIGGFYLVRARSYDEAESIASRSPHLAYGGTIELRAIEETGGN